METYPLFLTEINAWFALLSHSSRTLALEIAIHF